MPKILIVDDDISLRNIYARYLTHDGFEVVEAGDGEQALLQFQDTKLDFILLDIRMPGVGGQHLLPALKHSHPESKVIVFSCHDLDSQRQMIKEAHAYFDKSKGCRALSTKVQSMISA